MSNIFEDIYDFFFGNDKKKKKKRKKKERRRAEAERQRQIALQRQAEEERQRRIALQRQAEEEQRQAEEEKQKIRSIADSFANQSLCELTYQKIIRAKNLGELRAVYEEAHCAYDIEWHTKTLPESYREAIIQKLYDTYRKSNNLKKLQEILEYVKQLRLADSLLHSIKSCRLSKRLQQLTDERVEIADFDVDELQRIKKEVSCARKIEQCAQELGEQKFQEIYEKLEYGYEKRDSDMLQEILAEVSS